MQEETLGSNIQLFENLPIVLYAGVKMGNKVKIAFWSLFHDI